MCVAYPGRVMSINGTHGMVDFSGTEVPVNLGTVNKGMAQFRKFDDLVKMKAKR